ncbi:hypothetical protein C9J48_06960 [Photobacterium profundum]|uniref:Anaerobic dimethyl sulfoxide reductase chain C n=1 Tax=Photobacterium profundum 3TCK TaxID=314280 RepID=Q1ZA49_9GAMM|nr:DmsC/YnfH family molybdoenzyme membrane anchor subunit [Photobacterium profundum]EAS45643.1 Anaerobic dimethyl sulfoxide reductase chain C [Photobacterium profundum 3TCK]PSV63200.1 hypothetical protein C9J48_06960 [Photobacterium profundum]
MHELPLVFFTVITQGVAGFFILFTLFMLCRPVKTNEITDIYMKPLLALWPILAIGGLAALSHMGTPTRALNIINGLKHSSALSLEIFSVSIFGGLGVLATWILWKRTNYTITLVSFITASIASIGMIWLISSVYKLPTVTLWDSSWTRVNFYITALNLGCGLTFLLMNLVNKDKHDNFISQAIRFACLSALIITIVTNTNYTLWLTSTLHTMGATLSPSSELLMTAKVTLLTIALVPAIMMRRPSSNRFVGLGIFSCLLVSELIGRICFYDLILIKQL